MRKTVPNGQFTDHRQIVEALVRRDANLASRLVREHTIKLRDHVEQHVDLS